jgi:hypothetical protein
VEKHHGLLHQHEIVLDKSIFDEDILVERHHFIKLTGEPVSKDFGYQFCKVVHQANGLKSII